MKKVALFFVRIIVALAGFPLVDELEGGLQWVWDTLKIWARRVRDDLEGRRMV